MYALMGDAFASVGLNIEISALYPYHIHIGNGVSGSLLSITKDKIFISMHKYEGGVGGLLEKMYYNNEGGGRHRGNTRENVL
jgi:hypothetical protein